MYGTHRFLCTCTVSLHLTSGSDSSMIICLKEKMLLKEGTYHKYDDENKTDPYYY